MKMTAMVIEEFGSSNVFKRTSIDVPEMGDHELTVRVEAASVNPVDCKIRNDGTKAGIELPAILGYDVAGVVERAGQRVTDFKAGDEVFYSLPIFGQRYGSYAQYQVVDAGLVCHKPRNWDFFESAGLPMAGTTAWSAIHEKGCVQSHNVILIVGTGGVGNYAVQLAKAAGAYVICVASPVVMAKTRLHGADYVINYDNEDFGAMISKEMGEPAIDLVIDTVGGDTLEKCIPLMKPYRRMVEMVGTSGNLNAALSKNLALHFLSIRPDAKKLQALKQLAERSLIKPNIDSIMPLSEVAYAHDRMEQGGLKGKIVLDIDH